MKAGVAKRGRLQTPRTLLPDVETLSACLTAAFDGHDSCGEEVRILDRKQLPRMMSTSPNEVVTCQWANDSKSRVFIPSWTAMRMLGSTPEKCCTWGAERQEPVASAVRSRRRAGLSRKAPDAASSAAR